jgi:energy-coupling factor transporter ATP-binding protein EcfA2
LQWLWAHQTYQKWSSGDESDILLIEGKPGSGKSTLTKYFKRHLLEREPEVGQIVATFFYSYREGESQKDHYNMLRSVLYNALDQNETFFSYFQKRYRQAARREPFRWPYDSLKEILLSLRDHPIEVRLYLIVDAVDESDDRDRLEIVQLLRQLCETKESCVVRSKVFIASRPIKGLDRHSAEIANLKVITLQDVNKPDISRFTRSFLGPNLGLSPNLIHEAIEYIIQNAQGVFIWVHLVRGEVLEYSKTGCTGKELFNFLKSLPTELEGFYSRILAELETRNDRDIDVGFRMLQFVLFARRPLRLEELRHALAIPDKVDAEFSCSEKSFEEELIEGIDKRIIQCSGNFLDIKVVHGTPLYGIILSGHFS